MTIQSKNIPFQKSVTKCFSRKKFSASCLNLLHLKVIFQVSWACAMVTLKWPKN